MPPRSFFPPSARLPRRATAWLTASLALGVLMPREAAAVQIVVTTTEDEDKVDGDCSLREAIVAAETNARRDACPAGGTNLPTADDHGDVIVLANAVYPIRDTLNIKTSLTIAGPAIDRPAILDGNTCNNRGISITAPSGRGNVVLRHLRVQDFYAGAVATRTTGVDLVIVGCEFLGNGNAGNGLAGGAIRSSTNLWIHSSYFAYNAADAGGAIHASGLSCNSTVVDSNGALNGGGIFTTGSGGSVRNSSVTNNYASVAGAGIYNDSTSLTIGASTISGNYATDRGGGVYTRAGKATIDEATIVFNSAYGSAGGGGVYVSSSSSAPLQLKNSILDGNTTPVGVAGPDCKGAITTAAANLIRSTNGCTGVGGGTLIGVDARLKPLTAIDRRTGRTQIHLPAGDSPVVNRGTTTSYTDQWLRARRRPTWDIGAVDRQPGDPF